MKNLMLLMVMLAMFGPSRSLAVTEPSNEEEPLTEYHYTHGGSKDSESTLLIENSLDDRKPEGYQFGPVTEIRVDPPGTIFRIVSYNFARLNSIDRYDDKKSNPILQIWRTAIIEKESLSSDLMTEYEDPKLVQELRLKRGAVSTPPLVQNIGWISINAKPAFYVLVKTYDYMELITLFQFNETNERFDIISQDQVEAQLMWVIYDIGGIGDCFVGTTYDGPCIVPNYKGWSRIDMYNYSNNGVLAQYETSIDDILSPDIIDKLYANEFTYQDYINTVSCGLKYALHKFTKYEDSDFYNKMFTLENADGTKYYTRYGPLDEGWVEVGVEQANP